MRRWASVIVGVCVFAVPTMADVFNMGGTRNPDGSWTGLASLETVTVGNPGNAPDTRYVSPGHGSVGYAFEMGKYEITAGQYCEFLNAVAATDTYGLYNANMWSDTYGCKIQRSWSSGAYTYSIPDANYANRPVNYVSWGDAARFCNWLHNGQPTGAQSLSTTEDGSYYLNGATTDAQLAVITRKPNATWVIPSEDEWYKAAYHKNDGVTGNYWDYPTGTNSVPSNDLINPDPGNNANFRQGDFTIGSPSWRTSVGEFENSDSPYGTFDQGGNMLEWNETVLYGYRCQRGGSFDIDHTNLLAKNRTWTLPSYANASTGGFRVVAVPEPTTLALTVVNPTCGTVTIEPNDPNSEPFHYPLGTNVTLTATPTSGNIFKWWTIYDPNYPGDGNHARLDANTPITITMDTDRAVDAYFDFSSGVAPMLPLTVRVGNPGNAGELSGEGAGGFGPNCICGAVDYVYYIGKFEITAGQYTEFLNAVADTDTYGLHDPCMWSGGYGCGIQRIGLSGSHTYYISDANYANRPVNYLSWANAARFCNWLHNGQPTGAQGLATTEDGSYYLNGATTNAQLMAVTRKANATWVLPSEDEWYKAAYHKNDGVTGNYWDFPTGTDSGPSPTWIDPDPGNNANFDRIIGSPYYRTPVGEFENSDSPYGTFDQGGNVWEWNEANMPGSERGVRGGSFHDPGNTLFASHRYSNDPTQGSYHVGFRVAKVKSALVLTGINPSWGTISVEPNDPNWGAFHYPFGTTVTLTATPIEGKYFRQWTIYDPNYAGDANYAMIDANTSTTIVMNTDMQVEAAFKCSSGLAPMLPLTAVGLGGFALLRRRR